MHKILEGIHHFQHHVFPKKRALFERLASGQSPEAFFVGCSDSRVALDLVTQTGPGDLFVCRNAGNIVPAHGEPDAVSASIEYAVCCLGVRDIVVCGHSDCGAMKGLLHPEAVDQMPHVKHWLRHAEGARHAVHQLRKGASEPDLLIAMTKLNARLQLDHLRTHPHVFARLQTRELNLHAWVYDIGSGEVEAWDAAAGTWEHISGTVGPQPVLSMRGIRHA